jgi:predicted ATPase
MQELAPERRAVARAISALRLTPVMFELGARPHPPRTVYRAYLAQSQVFVGIYWQSYGWVAPGQQISGLEDEYLLSAGLPRLIYVKSPALEREPRLADMLTRIENEGSLSYRRFSDPAELARLVQDDLAALLTERFEITRSGDGAADDMPPVGAIPEPVTPLLGRDREIAALEDLVIRERVRLVTLTGPGGVGKTRLAMEAARRLGAQFADGARFVDLASVTAADLVAAAIAAGLGLRTSAGRLITDLQSYLRARRLLLVLDNFEQVIGAAPLVTELLAAAPGLVLLVTSRTVLRLRGEHETPVPPLPVPPAETGRDAADLRGYASVDLFVERAHAAAPGFELTRENAEAVAEICRRLDGLPLALELAAARIRLLPPQALAARLDQRLGLLTGGDRDLPERQQTLRNTLQWSFSLLPADQQALFARLAVFAGPFTLPAAEAVGADAGATSQDRRRAGTVLDTLESLIDASLLRSGARGGEPQFSLLETIREYALERLADGQDWREAHDRHAAYYLGLTEQAAGGLHGPGQLEWLDRLEAEHDNVRAAMSWLAGQGPPEQVLRMNLGIWRFLFLHGHAAEYTGLQEQLVANSERMRPYHHAIALATAGFTLFANGDLARARTMFEQSLPLLRQERGPLAEAQIATALDILGRLATLRGDYSGAGELLGQSQAVLRTLDDQDLTGDERAQYLLATALRDNFAGQVRLSQGDHQGAARLFTDGLSAARRAQDLFPVLVSLYDLSLASQARGDQAGAGEYLREGLALAAKADDDTSAVYYLEGLAAIAGQQDNPQRAARLLTAARSLLDTRGSGWLHAYVPLMGHDDAVLATLRARLGDAAFEQAQAWGRSTASTDAVQYALEHNNRHAQSPPPADGNVSDPQHGAETDHKLPASEISSVSRWGSPQPDAW